MTEYGLYETTTSKGIEHTFDKGVHVIAGINGLGKTTLLNIIYRCLLGPRDMSKEDGGLASTQHKLVDWRNKKYFRARVRDSARSASMEADITFGKAKLTVRRSLATLEVQFLSLDGKPETVATQDRYEELVQQLSGTASYFDFFAILRFLIFFLEDRPELIWDRRSQFDMFRLLFYDREAAGAAATAYDEVQRLDSQYRNERVPIRAAQEELAQYDAAEQSGIGAQIRGLRRALLAAQETDADFADAIELARAEYESAKLRREKSRLDLEEVRRAYEHEQELFYQDVFPDLAETAEHVFLNLAAGGGCLVCGNKSAAARDRLREFAAKHQCPICESTVDQQENVVSAATFNQKRLERAALEAEQLKEELKRVDDELKRYDGELRGQIEARQSSVGELVRLQRLLADLQRQASPDVVAALVTDDEDQIAFKRKFVEQGEARLARLAAERTAAETKYRILKDGQQKRLAGKLTQVKGAFARIAKHLLAETCLLRETKDSRKIGQEGETFDFPILEVMMSSAVFAGSPSAREDVTSVSESQREFIDLAFRMALMEAAADVGGASMLVLETPEASLDSLFVIQAGALFREFAAAGGTMGNVFIASTNLNDENMIPALFGAALPPARQPTVPDDESPLAPDAGPGEEGPVPPILPVEKRSAHVVNLLALALPNAALRAHRRYYEDKLRDAVYQDVSAEMRPQGPIGTSAPRRAGDIPETSST
ncbi:AAA family ATPase [Mesorhizobium sp. CA10]|uniref:AAA family ATPase n=1 Tax=Mesorhizobium sp. CA10 TaxID=588495 RepID=UPI001CC94CB2|nr:ATP-binding protein [Mesorhizobium sp. CA10]MBZ9882728.1 AAA family ATPase [Mesorhizobium sp. CA10]